MHGDPRRLATILAIQRDIAEYGPWTHARMTDPAIYAGIEIVHQYSDLVDRAEFSQIDIPISKDRVRTACAARTLFLYSAASNEASASFAAAVGTRYSPGRAPV